MCWLRARKSRDHSDTDGFRPRSNGNRAPIVQNNDAPVPNPRLSSNMDSSIQIVSRKSRDHSDTDGFRPSSNGNRAPIVQNNDAPVPNPRLSSNMDSSIQIVPQEQPENSNNLGVERFRILIMGNANAGKTTILKKVCHAKRREPVHPNINSEFHPSILRGEHDIEHQCPCPAAHSFVFHDSRGFEAGSADELKKVRDFIESRAKMEQLKDQLHVIWLCLSTSNDRGMSEAEMSLFESGTGNVPVIAIFTKMDALDAEARNQLMCDDVPLAKIKEEVPIRAEAIFRSNYLQRLEGVKHRPHYVVQLRNMDKEGTKCEELILRTSQALNVDLTMYWPQARKSRDQSDIERPSSNDNTAPNMVQNNNDAPVPISRLPSKAVHNNDAPVPDSRLLSNIVQHKDAPVPISRPPWKAVRDNDAPVHYSRLLRATKMPPKLVQNNDAPVPDSRLPSNIVQNKDALVPISRLSSKVVHDKDAPVPDSRRSSKVVHDKDAPVPISRLPSKAVQNNDAPVLNSRLPSKVVQNNDAPVLDSRLPSKVVHNNNAPVPDSRLPSSRIHNNDASVSNSPLPSTVEAVTADFPRIRILVLGKTGCGKSLLINQILGVNLAEVSHDRPGKVDINTGLLHSSNNRFILHDSEGFEPGEDAKLNKVKRFIDERTQSKMLPKDKLHVIWICISVPTANDRVIEPGVEEVFKMAQERKLPAIIIFTKYDKLVTSATASGAIDHLDKEQMWKYGENKASEDFEKLCIRPWREAVGKVPLMVSTRPRYKNTIQAVIQATDAEIQRQTGLTSRTEPRSFNFAAA